MVWDNSLQIRALAKKEKARLAQIAYASLRGPYKKKTQDYLRALQKRAESKGMGFDLTEEWLEAKMALEFCEATGLKFEGKGNEPYGRTVDRKDSSIGYTMDNCWATCWLYNRCKMEHTHQDVLNMARSMVKLNENES